MPGLDYFRETESTQAPAAVETHEPIDSEPSSPADSMPIDNGLTPPPGVYYNPRLDPKNYLEGPLSWNPATRLRQMLARPGIVVSSDLRCQQ